MAKKNEIEKPRRKTSFQKTIARFNSLFDHYRESLPAEAFERATRRAGELFNGIPQVQNQRVKGIPSLPNDYTKAKIGEFLRNPYASEKELRQTSEILRWTAYPYFKITKSYQDIMTYRHYAMPLYLDAEEAKSPEFKREAVLVDKFVKTFRPHILAHEAVGGAATLGKVFYTYRYRVDKSHNTVPHAFWQQLPQDYCMLVGKNNVSGWTVAFNMMYFMQPGTSVYDFGDLFEPYLDDFQSMFEPPADGRNAVYASIKTNGGDIRFYYRNADRLGGRTGSPRSEYRNSVWMYWVTLPIDRVFTFEIDDITPAVASPLAGLMLTYAQQSDFEEAQLALTLSPLIAILTGEIPYFKESQIGDEDSYRLSEGGRDLFEAYFNEMMAANNTAGISFFTAPVENIKSHFFPESANANGISQSFNEYASGKSGLSAIIPVQSDIKAAQVMASEALEGKYAERIYKQIENMMNVIFDRLNLNYDWQFRMFGTIYDEAEIRTNAQRDFELGDTSAVFILSALNGQSWIDKLSMMRTVNASGIMSELTIPQTAYTQSASTGKNGRPKTTLEDAMAGEGSIEAKEKQIDQLGE